MNRVGICVYLVKQVSFMEHNLPLPSDLLFQALEQNPLAMLVTNLKGEICYANKAMLEMSGYSIDEILGKST